MKQISNFLNALSALSGISGISFTLKLTVGAWMKYLPASLRWHSCDYCSFVKSAGSIRQMNCVDHHRKCLERAALECNASFRCECFAGVAELIVPLIVGDRFCGMIAAGPFEGELYGKLLPDEKKIPSIPVLDKAMEENLTVLLRQLIRSAGLERDLPDEDTPLLLLEGQTLTDERIIRCLAYLKDNMGCRIRADELARRFCVSRSRFLHCFRVQTGISFRDYLQRFRMQRALELVEFTSLPFGNIAELCGFPDAARFSAQFKYFFDCTPSKRRRKRIAYS